MSHPVKHFYENIQCHLEKFIDDEEAATMVEYIMLAVAASLILVAVLPALSNSATVNEWRVRSRMTNPLKKGKAH
jgi:Flp pilus assembly pilin Flp